MKYIMVVPDGLTEKPWADEKTPLEVAKTPNLDALAKRGVLGFTRTIPRGFHPGSEIGNMSLLGYDPKVYFTGRGPIEAASKGLELESGDLVFRCNLVTLYATLNNVYMADYSAGHITDQEASELIEHLNEYLGRDDFYFVKGKSYRNLLVWKDGERPKGIESLRLPPPHDIVGKNIFEYLGEQHKPILEILTQSQLLLKDHPVNKKRREKGVPEANSIWLWGQGFMPSLYSFEEAYGVKGGVISAVDLIKGLGRLAGLKVLEVEGATGYLDTNYEGKAQEALRFLREEGDFVYVHIEAPDEAGHSGEFDLKVKAIEDFDQRFLGTLLKGLEELGDWRMLIVPDHPTPLDIKTHCSDPVPFLFVFSSSTGDRRRVFSEREKGDIFIDDATRLVKILFERERFED